MNLELPGARNTRCKRPQHSFKPLPRLPHRIWCPLDNRVDDEYGHQLEAPSLRWSALRKLSGDDLGLFFRAQSGAAASIVVFAGTLGLGLATGPSQAQENSFRTMDRTGLIGLGFSTPRPVLTNGSGKASKDTSY